MSRPPLPVLLAAAADVLGRAGELPPVSVTCCRSPNYATLPAVTISAASLQMADGEQRAIVRTAAAALKWNVNIVNPFGDGTGLSARRVVDQYGHRVDALQGEDPSRHHFH